MGSAWKDNRRKVKDRERVGSRDLWRGDAKGVRWMDEALRSGVYQHWKVLQAGSGAGSGEASRATSA